MAIYSASVKTISRKAGRSATAAAAYRTGSEVIDERQGLIHDYTRKGGVDHVSQHLPHGLKLNTHDIWNRAEHAEKRKDATVARELVVALPHEMTSVQRTALADSIAMELVGRYQVAAECSVHLPDKEGDQRNNHAHIQFSTRRMNEDGSFGAKTRELDDIKQGKVEVEWIRTMVEEKTNVALEAAGLEVRVDRRSLKDQRAAALEVGDFLMAQELDRAPQIHNGPRVTQILREAEKEGRTPLGVLDRAAVNDGIGFDLEAGKAELAEVISMIDFIEKRDAGRTVAHAEAIKEDRLRDRLTAARAEHKSIESERIDLAIELDKGEPSYVQEARNMRKEMINAKAKAKTFREENVWFSKFADVVGIKMETDRAAEYATAKFVKSPERKLAKTWSSEHKENSANYKKLVKEEAACEAKVSRLDAAVSALNRPDPEVVQAIKEEVAQGIESARPEITEFVDKHASDIAAAAEFGGVDAWMSTEIIATGIPAIDELSRKAAQFKSRMMREELARAEETGRLQGQAIQKFQASLSKALDSSFKSAAREAEPTDHAAEGRRITAQAAALRASKQPPAEYVPTWKRGRHDDSDLNYEP